MSGRAARLQEVDRVPMPQIVEAKRPEIRLTVARRFRRFCRFPKLLLDRLGEAG